MPGFQEVLEQPSFGFHFASSHDFWILWIPLDLWPGITHAAWLSLAMDCVLISNNFCHIFRMRPGDTWKIWIPSKPEAYQKSCVQTTAPRVVKQSKQVM